jgi:two-component system sensor histidine kinase YesM
MRSVFKKILTPIIGFYRNIPIKYKLMLVLNLVMMISLTGLSYINYKNSEASLTKKSTQYTHDILKMLDIRLSDYVQNLVLLSQDMLPDERTVLSINYYNSTDSLLIYEEAFRIENVLKRALFSHNEIQSIAIISNRGKYHPADRNNREVSIKSLVPYKSALYEKIVTAAREKSGYPVFYADSHDGRVRNLFLVRMVYSVSDFEEVGVMVILLRTDYLYDVLIELANEDMQNIMVLTSRNDVIVDRNRELTDSISKQYDMMEGPKGWFLDESRGSIISYLAMDKAPGWKIISSVSLASLYRDIDNLKREIILSSVIMVFILSMISLLMTADFIRPFRKLISGMERVRQGERDVSIVLDRKDEIGYLGEAFNRMVKEMNTLSDWVVQEQLTRKEAEIKALQSQINPHFLFNTLESVNWMARLNNVPEISVMVTALSSLMEASIGRDDKLITLREELNYVDSYFLILRRRFEDRVEFVSMIDEKALEVKIPRLLIQPLIENAIKHGIEYNKARGRITLYVDFEGSNIRIIVEDDGDGISQDDLEIINDTLSMDNDTYFRRIHSGMAKSVGLDNVNRRIKLFYGEDYGLTVESRKDSYTRAIVIIPAQCPEGALLKLSSGGMVKA